MSNTVDNITESAANGHLVKIDFDGVNYTLTDPSDPTNTRTIAAASLQQDGSYKVYNPVNDTFTSVTAANKDEATKISVVDKGTGDFRDLTGGDIYWRTRF